ncbi:MAG: Cna B-type domain-containing protein [Acetobacterium sp.]
MRRMKIQERLLAMLLAVMIMVVSSVGNFAMAEDEGSQIVPSPVEGTTADVTGTITWIEEARPDEMVYLQLYQGNTTCGSPIALDGVIDESLDAVGSGELEVWKYTWKGLLTVDALDAAYSYTVKEVDSAGVDYIPAGYEKTEVGLTVTNTKISVSDPAANPGDYEPATPREEPIEPITPLEVPSEPTPPVMDPAENQLIGAPWIASDLADYPPGGLVTLTGGGWTGDSEVKIVIEDSSGLTQIWTFEKVVPVAADGSIEIKFNLSVRYVPQYRVTATGLTTERVAAAAFTDASGSYSLDFSAYDPVYYDFKLPSDYPTVPSGRAADPMTGANGAHPVLNSLEPRDLALGQIVPFEIAITVKGSTAPEGGVIQYDCLWGTVTSSGSNIGFDPAYMVYAAFVDYADPRIVDNGIPATATILSTVMSGSNIRGSVKVSGLDNGDKIIVEMWVVLKTQLPASISGNVPAAMDSAQTAAGDRINTGNQTVPLNQTAKFTTETAEVSIIKTDTPDPLYSGDTLTYKVTATNNSTTTVANGIIVTDTLDLKVTFVSATGGGILSGGNVIWPTFALDSLAQKIFTVTVTVNSDAPTEAYGGTASHMGSATGTRFINADISNIVRFTMITQDSNQNNNVWQEPTNILPRISVTAYKDWVGGPTADHIPMNLILYRQVGTGLRTAVPGVSATITPLVGPANRFTYIWTGLPMYDASFQPYIYTVDESMVPANYTKKIVANTITNTYKPSLTISKVYGTKPLPGTIFSIYAGNASGPTGGSMGSVTTGSDGKATFAHLADGIYWLVETKPPTGYKWINDIGIFIVANGIITGPAGYIPAAQVTTGDYIVIVQNEPVRELPKAGGNGEMPFAAGGLGLMLLAIFLAKRKKSEAEQ